MIWPGLVLPTPTYFPAGRHDGHGVQDREKTRVGTSVGDCTTNKSSLVSAAKKYFSHKINNEMLRVKHVFKGISGNDSE